MLLAYIAGQVKRKEVSTMTRFRIPRIAHCSQGHAVVPGMTENCPTQRGD